MPGPAHVNGAGEHTPDRRPCGTPDAPARQSRAALDIARYFRLMAQRNASDLLLSPGAPPHLKVDGNTIALGGEPLPPGRVKELAYRLIGRDRAAAFERTLELNLAVSARGLGRFRVNVFRARGDVAMVIRHVGERIPDFDTLHLPQVLKDLVMAPRGLILVAGASGAGKSTTLASMIDHRNRHRSGHILTVEDPIEYIHRHRRSVVDQREVGLDTLSYASALKNALREAPDVILIGEIRDRTTMGQALAYAQTGHLCLSSLHAGNARQALERVLSFFPDSAHRRLRRDLAMCLKAVIAQRLVPACNGRRIPAVEILLNSVYVAQLLAAGDFEALKGPMEKGDGMQTFDQALHALYRAGRILPDGAAAHADTPHDLSLKIRLGREHPAQG